MKLVIDPRQSGLSGDMLISTLTDFFDCHDYTNSLLQSICSEAEKLFGLKSSYNVDKTTINSITGSKLVFLVEKDFGHLSVHDFIENWKKILENIQIPISVSKKVFNILDKIIQVEQTVHGKEKNSLHEIHFHELNSIDTIIDITVTVSILEHEQIQELFGLPTAIGTGMITFSHGTFQQPAPAVAKILELTSYPMVSRDLEFELTTPTGLAILTSLVNENNTLNNLPQGKIKKSGLGFGQKQVKNYPNFMKVWGFEELQTENDHMVIIETHVDDVSGELLGNIIESYTLVAGVKDVSIYPLIMKKNRPGNCIRLLVDPLAIDLEEISIKLMKDTGSLGVRHYPVSRHKSVRSIQEQRISIEHEQFTVRLKISKIGDDIIAMKPEYDDIKTISIKTNRSLKEIQDEVLKQLTK